MFAYTLLIQIKLELVNVKKVNVIIHGNPKLYFFQHIPITAEIDT